MVKLREIFMNCDSFDTVLLYLLGEEEPSKWKELTEMYNDIFRNICCIKPKTTDYVMTTLKRVSVDPFEYDFFYTTRKAAFECDKDKFEDTYQIFQFTDSSLDVLMGMYICDDIDYFEHEIFLAEIFRKVAKYCSFVKRKYLIHERYLIEHNPEEMKEYLINKRESYLLFEESLREYPTFFIKNTIAKESLKYIEREIGDNEHIPGFRRLHWPYFILSPVFVSYVKLIWNVLGIFERVEPDIERLNNMLREYKEKILSDYCNGYTTSRNERIVIEYPFSKDEELPMIYVVNDRWEKSELREYSLNRILSMPIECPNCIEWEYAGAYLMLYMAYPRMYTRYRRNVAIHCLYEVITKKLEMDGFAYKHLEEMDWERDYSEEEFYNESLEEMLEKTLGMLDEWELEQIQPCEYDSAFDDEE